MGCAALGEKMASVMDQDEVRDFAADVYAALYIAEVEAIVRQPEQSIRAFISKGV